MPDSNNVYEIEFDVPGHSRTEFEDWVSSDVIGWVSHEKVAYFEVFRNDKGLSPEVKFVFGFDSLRDWATFVGSDEHEAAIDDLGTLAENREAVLWQRASVKLDGLPDESVDDTNRHENIKC